MQNLFSKNQADQKFAMAPLAERMRPRNFSEYVGQEALIGEGKPLRTLIENDELPSMIFWGPPGSGKTTLARLIATVTQAEFVPLSAVMAGVAEIRSAVGQAETRLMYQQKRTVLFIDEIHRFNKSQQDALLPYVENGTIVLIGATTENPSFEVISALLSRCRVFVLEALDVLYLEMIVKQALSDVERGLGKFHATLGDGVLAELVSQSGGDARFVLSVLDIAVRSVKMRKGEPLIVSLEHLRRTLQRSHVAYDKQGEEHYNIISALHKSLRGSDPQAGVYWLARMLEGGEDPLYIARRLVRFSSEDVGLADPQALVQATAAFQACHQIGMPECTVILTQLVVYLALVPKSNAAYVAYQQAAADVHAHPNDPVPLHIRNAPTDLMKGLGYGKGYKYNPDFVEPVDQTYLPERLLGKVYWVSPSTTPKPKRKS